MNENKNPTVGPRLVIAIASGKGGTGKSLIAASMGVYLAQLGKQVVLVDANFGSSNLHTLLGIDEPKTTLHRFLTKQVEHLTDVVAPTPFEGLGLISGHDDGITCADPRPGQRMRLLSQARCLDTDYVIFDLAPGSGNSVLDLFLGADLQLVVTVPEPPAIESAFRLVKSAFVRKARSINGVDRLVTDLTPFAYCGIPTPNQLYELGKERHTQLGDELREAMESFRPRLIVNKTRTHEDMELGSALTIIGRRHLGLPFDYLGYIEGDDLAWAMVRKRRPLLVGHPEAKVCKDLERTTRRILALETQESPSCMRLPKAAGAQTHYEVLGIHPGASEEEIRSAHRRARRMYDGQSAAVYGVVPPNEVNSQQRRIEDAYSTLIDRERRQAYNAKLPPLDDHDITMVPAALELYAPAVSHATIEPSKTPRNAEPTPMPLVDAQTEFSGAMLRQIRQSLGIDLHHVAEGTKISLAYLTAIEEEQFNETPAAVYLRGFVKAIARYLRLDAEQVARTYMLRYEQRRRPSTAQSPLRTTTSAN